MLKETMECNLDVTFTMEERTVIKKTSDGFCFKKIMIPIPLKEYRYVNPFLAPSIKMCSYHMIKSVFIVVFVLKID